MADTMMGGEDGNGSKDWGTVYDLVKTVPAVCGERELGTAWPPLACSNDAPSKSSTPFCRPSPSRKFTVLLAPGGWLPLHCACVTQASLEVVMLLLNKFPEGALSGTMMADYPSIVQRGFVPRPSASLSAALLAKGARVLDAGLLGKQKREELDKERRKAHDEQQAFEARRSQG